MNDDIKQFIEEHIEWIENNEWVQFFSEESNYPEGIGEPLYTCEIPFMRELEYVPDYAFYKCSLKDINVPIDVMNIGSWAFAESTSLTNIKMPGVIDIWDKAFYNCTSLTSVDMPNSLESIGYGAFHNCTRLTRVNLGDSVESIHSLAFKGCTRLESIDIPDSVTSIGYMAFQDCTSLKSIKFNGTKAQWSSISKGFDWAKHVPATVVVCIDGNVTNW